MYGQINTLIALTDINQGDGGTMLIPGSHKSNLRHPYHGNFSMGQNRSVDDIERGTLHESWRCTSCLWMVFHTARPNGSIRETVEL